MEKEVSGLEKPKDTISKSANPSIELNDGVKSGGRVLPWSDIMLFMC